MNRKALIKKYLDFFKSKNHKEIPNVSLVPENDPTVLFTTAGMHPLVPFLIGKKHPLGKRLVNVQKCIRTQDIDEVGDTFHHTFFEMLGNWSLGDYWKKEAIEYSLEFLTKVLKIPKEKISVTCFKGDKDVKKDIESAEIWQSFSIKKSKIKFLPKSENWWGPAGATGPCGPDTEMFVNGFEIWNDVFMQYNKTADGKYKELKQKNVDTGMGVERTIAILNDLKDDYLTDSFLPMIREIEKLSKKKYGRDKGQIRAMRIIADHIKASVFIIADGVVPGNVERGYVLRRLIRRAIRHGKELEIENFTTKIALPVFDIYTDYKHITKNKLKILEVLKEEENKFNKTLIGGMRVFNKVITSKVGWEKEGKIEYGKERKVLIGKYAFLLYQSYGFPIELTREIAKEKGIEVDEKGFEQEMQKHQELSRTASVGRFKSGLADSSEATKKLHTATHLLNQALREILKKPDIHQKGSNINPKRLRFDFNFDRKLTSEEIKKIENLVNKKIQENLPVICREIGLQEAKKLGAQGVFEEKYQGLKKVKVYTIGNFSKEICAGPHVKNTGELGSFKILKEGSIAAGIRRIKAVLE